MTHQTKTHTNPPQIVMIGPTLAQQGGIASVENLILQYAPQDIKIEHLSSHEEASAGRRVVVFTKTLFQVMTKLLQGKLDLVHLHVSERGSVWRKMILTLIVAAWGKPVLLHAHGAEFASFYEKLPQTLQKLIGWTFRHSTYFIVLSDHWKDFYTHCLGLKTDQVIVLANSIEIPAQIPNRNQSEKIKFVFLGRIGQRKGAFDLIQAFAALPTEQQQRSHLTLAGDGESQAARVLVEQLQLSDRITIRDWISPAERNELLAQSDVFVLPSYNEGLPMALLEAMSWGLAPITTPVGGIPEAIAHQQNGLLVPPGEITELTAALQSLIDDPKFMRSLGENARNWVLPLDVKNYTQSLARLYRSALGHEDPAAFKNSAEVKFTEYPTQQLK